MDKKNNEFSGWLVLNKPKGLSSNSTLFALKKIIGKKVKIGHAGTLDPLAEGVLPVAIGEATKTAGYLMDAEKEYYFDITWGEERSTFDAEGEVTAQGGIIPDENDVAEALKDFVGDIMQVPPIFSALKIEGKPAYKLARKGIDVQLVPRQIKIKELELISHDKENKNSKLRVLCGKGTYVRSLAVDIARKLGGFGYVSFLKRSKVGDFLIKDAKVLDNLDKIVHNLLPITFGLGDILVIKVSPEQALKIKNGLKIVLPHFIDQSFDLVQVRIEEKLVAIARIDSGKCIPLRVFN